MRTDELDFALPTELIAQHPPPRRGDSRLLHYRRAEKKIAHRRFEELPDILSNTDLLVFNDARVLPARFTLIKPTGGKVEGLFLRQRDDALWIVMLKNLGSSQVDRPLTFEGEPTTNVRVVGREADAFLLKIDSANPATAVLSRIGRMPLPPYIRRNKGQDTNDPSDSERYQTVYAAASGSVAAPTAGLHFTPELMAALEQRSIEKAYVTLHVGAGTFKPLTADTLDQHAMHSEQYEIHPPAASSINAATAHRRRIVAIGTTSARVLESQPAEQLVAVGRFETSILIYPPYAWRRVGALLTNFHLPRSTLVALVAAFVGLQEQHRIYREAVEQRYRFFSYGDAMFVE